MFHDLPRGESIVGAIWNRGLTPYVAFMHGKSASQRGFAKSFRRFISAHVSASILEVLQIVSVSTANFHNTLPAQPKAIYKIFGLPRLILLHLRGVTDRHEVILIKVLGELRLDLHEPAFVTVEDFEGNRLVPLELLRAQHERNIGWRLVEPEKGGRICSSAEPTRWHGHLWQK